MESLKQSLAEAEGALDEMDDLRRKLKVAEEELESKYEIFKDIRLLLHNTHLIFKNRLVFSIDMSID